MQQQVHHAEAVRIGDQLRTDEGAMSLEMRLCLGQLVEIVGAVLDVAVGCDQEASRAGGRVLYHLARLRLHEAHNAVDERTRREVLARSRFLLRGILLQKALVKLPKALLPC